MVKRLFIVCLLMFYMMIGFAQNPTFNCIAVLNNGNVTVTWDKPVNTTGFIEYEIFRSGSLAGVYSQVGNVTNVNTTTFQDITANGNIQSYFYYIATKTSLGSFPSDTLHSIFPQAVKTTGISVNLYWNSISSKFNGNYIIFRKQSISGTWSQIQTTTQLNIFDTVQTCSDSIYYRIEINHPSGCQSVSSVHSEYFKDNIIPKKPTTDSISIDNVNNKITIGWEASPSSDTYGYAISRGNPSLVIDTVVGRFNTFYIDTDNAIDPKTKTYEYKIAALDSCGNSSILDVVQKNILLSANSDFCAGKINLNWSAYINMKNGLGGYAVFVSKNGGNDTVVAEVGSSVLSYSYAFPDDSATYCIIVKAFNVGKTIYASSNQVCLTVTKPKKPEFIYIQKLEVEDHRNSTVKLQFTVDTKSQGTGFKLYYSTGTDSQFYDLATIPNNGSSTYEYTHLGIDAQESLLKYKVIALDSCGNLTTESNILYTILLTGKTSDNINQLTWTRAIGFSNPVDSYEIYRSTLPSSLGTKIATVSGATYTYTDDINSVSDATDRFYYRIKAIEQAGNVYNIQGEIISHFLELKKISDFVFPTGFDPSSGGTFGPIGLNINRDGYYFAVFARNGMKIFESRDPYRGWDGTYNGANCPTSVYMYIVNYIDEKGIYLQKKGSVTLIR